LGNDCKKVLVSSEDCVAGNLAIVRRRAFNMLRDEKAERCGMRGKQRNRPILWWAVRYNW